MRRYEPEAAMQPRVSVVMSVYNDATRVGDAVASILQQTFRDLELVVVDDGSTDGSAALLDRFAAADSRVRVLHRPNRGLTLALIEACEATAGAYIARQDSDDWSHPERIAEQLELIESDPRIGFVSCATQYVGPGDEPLLVMTRPTDPESATRALLRDRLGPPAHGSVMFRGSLYRAVGGYRDAFHYSQDSDLWLRMAERSLIAYLPGVRYVALREINSTSGVHRQLQRRYGEIALRCRADRVAGRDDAASLREAEALTRPLLEAGRDRGARGAAVADAAYFLGAQLQSNRDARAGRYLRTAIRARPWHWRAWLRLLSWVFVDRWRRAASVPTQPETNRIRLPPPRS
jgi:glycosyltransferase involved in cell wall biosynthesis